MSFLQMGFGMSQILGIPISLYLAKVWHWQAPFYLIVILASIIFIVAFFVLKPVNAHLKLQRDNAFKHLWQTISNKEYRIGFIATAFMSLGGYLMMPWGSTYSVNNIGISQEDLPLMFMIVGVATFAIMPVVGVLSDKLNKFTIFTGASVLMVVTVLIYTQLPKVSLFMLILVNVFMMMGIMARMVPSQALAASIPAMKDRGAFMSVNSSLQQMAGGVAALIGGWIVQQKTQSSPLENFDYLGYLVVAVILINIALTYRVYSFVSKRMDV
jgi:predicted MFS family arabinose efflux permease